jgi:hypothetical protein
MLAHRRIQRPVDEGENFSRSVRRTFWLQVDC